MRESLDVNPPTYYNADRERRRLFWRVIDPPLVSAVAIVLLVLIAVKHHVNIMDYVP